MKKTLVTLFLLFISFAAFAGDAKYIFFFIGDGMAMPQISSAEIYSGTTSNKDINIQKLAFTQFPVSGMVTTYDSSSFITDSASAGTAITTGNKTLSGIINMDPAKRNKFIPFTYDMKQSGYRIGIVSSVSLNHATPAAFYASVPSRGDMYDIGLQLAKSGFDYFGGGGFVQRQGKDNDSEDLFDIFKKAGYTVTTTKAQFDRLKNGTKAVVINENLQDSFSMPYDIDRKAGDLSLADHTRKAIEMLDNPNGFFLMVEGGKIDWACHANDAAASINDVFAFDKAISVAIEFYKKHPDDTLIIVTGDHETGGMSLGFAGTKYSTYFDKIARQQGSYLTFNETVIAPYKAKAKNGGSLNDLRPEIERFFGIDFNNFSNDELAQLEDAYTITMGGELENTSGEMLYLLFGGYEPLTVKLTQIINRQAGLSWASYSHTGVPVPLFATGSGAERFGGYYDNTGISTKIMEASIVETVNR